MQAAPQPFFLPLLYFAADGFFHLNQDIYSMCGIAGIVSLHPSSISSERLKLMTDRLVHRGPEGEAFWISPSHQAGFGHRRLCIIDLTEAGKQPMHYQDRYSIIYNGEIYNYPEIKADLEKQGYQFRSQTDTEVLLAAYACYKEKCLELLDGMFAFAIWDEEEQFLFIARDRFGEKPLYYTQQAGEFVFASEIKALWAAGIEKQYDEKMLLNFLTLGWTEHPSDNSRTFYKAVFAVPPAHYLIVTPGERLLRKRYWSLNKDVTHRIPIDDAIAQCRSLFYTSVNRRLRSDVSVGTSLSGGLDSSSVIAAASTFSNKQYTHKSFSAVFPGFEKDESSFISKTAAHLNVESFTVTPCAADLVDEFSTMMSYHDQPFHSASVYAQYKVYQLAKENGVTVLLDGQGADEVFAGYLKYIHWYLQELVSSFHISSYRKERKALLHHNIPFAFGARNIASAFMPAATSRQLKKKALQVQSANEDIDRRFFEAYHAPQSIFKPEVRKLNDILHYHTTKFGLQELLRYADINSMANSREVRLPFLNHELVEFIFSLPATMKIHEGSTKWIFRKAMDSVLPADVVWRKDKVGFEPPQQLWMEDKQVQDLIHEAKRTLVQKQILNQHALVKKNQPQVATAADDLDWRYLVAGSLLK